MSDSNGNGFGEALESMTTNTKKAIGGTIADFGKTVKRQVAGSSSPAGSFTPGSTPPNPNAAPGLQGGDLFSPDMLAGQKPSTQQQPHVGQAVSPTPQNPDAKTPEELEKMQKIQAELAQLKQTMHKQYYQEFLTKAEGKGKAQQEEEQEKVAEKKEEQMEDLQKKQEKQQYDDALLRAQTASERKGGGIG